jgi:hypothetical protein
VATESGTVGNAADAVETRHSNRTVQKDSADYGEVSCANDSVACRVGTAERSSALRLRHDDESPLPQTRCGNLIRIRQLGARVRVRGHEFRNDLWSPSPWPSPPLVNSNSNREMFSGGEGTFMLRFAEP